MAKILLVDDEKVARTLYGDYLLAEGHDVEFAESASEAKKALSRGDLSIVITDLILPDQDGMEVLRFAKETVPEIEVIVITALDRVDPAVRAIKSGAAEYLVKPVAPEVLQHAVKRALTSRQLLHENASLRAHLGLLETAQRLATTLDREGMAHTACTAFAQLTGAGAVMLFLPEADGAIRLEGAHGLESDLSPKLTELVKGKLPQGSESPVWFDPGLEAFRTAWIYPAADGDAVWGFAVLLFKAPGVQTSDAAAFLAKHLGLALRNLGRFAAVEDLAYIDDLTRLYNSRYLDLVLDREIRNAQQLQTPFSLLLLDLDYLKSVNDVHGHSVGSKLLVEVAKVIQGCIRDTDVAVRWGGDEYVLLLRGTDSGGALKVAERIRRTVEAHHFLARERLTIAITTCIGVASFPEHAHDKASLFDMADRAMYRGKKGTRNVVYMAAKGLEATPTDRHSSPTGALTSTSAEPPA